MKKAGVTLKIAFPRAAALWKTASERELYNDHLFFLFQGFPGDILANGNWFR